MNSFSIVAVVVFGFLAYLLPTLVATSRKHRSAGAIFAVNLLFGWTVIGWLGALIWGLTGNVEPRPVLAVPQTERSKHVGSVVNVMGGVVVALLLLWFLFGPGLEAVTRNEMGKIEAQIVRDAVAQYEIAKRHGSQIDRYVAAGFVKAACLQAKDDGCYAKWQKIEDTEKPR